MPEQQRPAGACCPRPTHRFLRAAWLAALLATPACAPPSEPPSDRPEVIDPARELLVRMRSLHRPMPPLQPGDWLVEHDEPGQSYEQWRRSRPVMAKGRRRVLYIQPIGTFTRGQHRIVEKTVSGLRHYFQLETRVLEPLGAEVIKAHARRTNPTDGHEQWLTTWILESILPPRLPEDGVAVLALTATDLWPGSGFNFVFGQASLAQRVGIWSIHRKGDADGDETAFRQVLLRTLKTATHETGHMFSLRHCIAWSCNMNGSNSLAESDRQPLWSCPQCLAKIVTAVGADARARFVALQQWCADEGLVQEADFYRRSALALPH